MCAAIQAMAASPSPVESGAETLRLERALDTWGQWSPALAARPCVIAAIGTGLTNHSWHIATTCGEAVVRINSPIGQRLGVNRHSEARILEALASSGITPSLWFSDPERNFLVTAFVPGRVWDARDMADGGQRQRLRAVISRYQQVVTGLPPRDYAAYLDHYWQQLQWFDIEVPALLAEQYWRCRDNIKRWHGNRGSAVLTHHDLSPGNIIDHDGRLYVLDWEYAAPGCGDLDLLAIGDRDCAPQVRDLAVLLNDFWFLLRDTPGG